MLHHFLVIYLSVSLLHLVLLIYYCHTLPYFVSMKQYLLLKFLLFSVRTGLEGPGLSVSQKIWYCLSTVGGQYLWSRLQSFSAFRRWGDSEQVMLQSVSFKLLWILIISVIIVGCIIQRSLARRLWILLRRVEGLYKAAAFCNLLLFLYNGRYLCQSDSSYISVSSILAHCNF